MFGLPSDKTAFTLRRHRFLSNGHNVRMVGTVYRLHVLVGNVFRIRCISEAYLTYLPGPACQGWPFPSWCFPSNDREHLSQHVLGMPIPASASLRVGPSGVANLPPHMTHRMTQPALRGRQCALADATAGRSTHCATPNDFDAIATLSAGRLVLNARRQSLTWGQRTTQASPHARRAPRPMTSTPQ